jgi:hypothetical protein
MEFSDLLGKTLISVRGAPGDDEIVFKTSDGGKYRLLHDQDCCESVLVEDVIGDYGDLLGTPLLMAEEVSNADGPERGDDSYTWTFYKLATVNGYVTIRWYGSSNGYYSEKVSFEVITEPSSVLTSAKERAEQVLLAKWVSVPTPTQEEFTRLSAIITKRGCLAQPNAWPVYKERTVLIIVSPSGPVISTTFAPASMSGMVLISATELAEAMKLVNSIPSREVISDVLKEESWKTR